MMSPGHRLLIVVAALTLTAGTVAAQSASTQVVYEAGSNLAVAATVEVSSAAGPPGTKYSLDGITDEFLDTWWASRANPPLPQWIRLSFEEPVTIDTLVLIQGDNDRIYANASLVELEFADGSSIREDLLDHPGFFIIRFPQRSTDSVQLTILEAHEERVYYTARQVMVFHDPEENVEVRVPPHQRWLQVDLTETGRERHPTVYLTPEDVERARERIERYDWARRLAEQTIARADSVVDHDPDWIRENAPDRDAAYAYGFTGCPICGTRWGSWRGANCSFDRPGTVQCREGHILPDEDHPDDGTGYVAEDGRIHYFVGSYNAWVVETYQQWADWLSLAYTFTGDEKYARTCAVILDAIAEIYPHATAGSWDYPSDPPSGRLCRPWYQVARVLVTLVDYYDKIYNSPALDEPSFVEGLTRRESIENRMLKDGAWYCYEQSLKSGMHNGQADYLRGVLAVGCLLGIEAYIDWTIDGPYGIHALVNNNADRDGRYYETSLSYAMHARSLYLTFAEPMFNYRSEQYPQGLNLYDDPKFRSFYVLPRLAMDCAGKWPRYGDSAPDSARTTPGERPFDARDYVFAERIYNRTSDPEVRRDFGALVNWLADGNVENARAGSGEAGWLLFHAREIPPPDRDLPEYLERMVTETSLMGQKGIVILRTPASPEAQALLLRYGPVLNHGHFDDLNINYFGLGYELTYDLGFGLGSTHTQVGWGKQTASHQLVLVDETRQLAADEDDTGGSLHMLAPMPGMQVVDADADGCYRAVGVDTYRRLLALAGDGPQSYLLDIFTVGGGSQHDYMSHALSDEISFEGISPGERETGSVAGPDINWGERQQNDGNMRGVAPRPYWVPPPPNGLGFMMHPRRAAADGPWSATWRLPDGDSFMRMTMLPEEGTEVINAWAPGLYPHNPRAEHVIARRISQDGPLTSTFVSIREPYGPSPVEIGGISGSELITRASTEDGAYRFLDSYGILLFQAEEFGGEMHLSLETPEAGDYYLLVAAFMSPNYGAVQALLNGEPLGEPFVTNNAALRDAPLQVLGPLALEAGEQRLTLRTVEHEGGQPWLAIRTVHLVTEPPAQAQAEAVPFIDRVERIPAPEGITALEVAHRSGTVDRFIYSPASDADAAAGELQLQGSFGHLQSAGAEPRSARLVGRSLSVPGFSLELATASHSGEIVRIDYERNLVYVDAALPTDGRLQYETVAFSNPAYSRNTAYTIHDVRREGDLSVIDLGPQRILLGQGTLDQDPMLEDRITSLTQHDYARGLTPGGGNFFAGKLLRSADGATSTNIRSTRFAQPMEFEVDSSAGFSEGDDFYYYDLQPGDSFVIRNWAVAQLDETGSVRITATDDVTVTLGEQTLNVPWSRP